MSEKYQYRIFDGTKTVTVDAAVVKEYESCLHTFHPHTAEYLILVEELTKEASEAEMEKAIADGIRHEIELFKEGPEIIERAIKAGIID